MTVCHLLTGERHQERIFKDWLAKCHRELDKTIKFEEIADEETQASTSGA